MSVRTTLARLVLGVLCFLCGAYADADIYQWKDEAGRIHFSDQKPAYPVVAVRSASEPIPASVKLDVPLVKQGKMLCGPATIEMLFRYWGIDDYDQYDIAYNLLMQFAESWRVKQSGILQTDPIDWNLYPGTGTINMREFLERFATTENPKLKRLPTNSHLAERERDGRFLQLKKYVAKGVPVIVHQYWGEIGSKGHYRLMTGYDDGKREVYLNDSTYGSVVTQSYERFLELWNVDETWLHYNAIVFNADKENLYINISEYSSL